MGKRYPFNGFEAMASGYTNGLYLPNKPLDEWNIDECRRALCRQANGDVMRCLECENKCRYGRRVEVLLAPPPVEMTEEKPADERKAKGWEKSAEARRRQSSIKYLQIIASGNPKAYLEAHGMEVRNNMSRLRSLYKDVTPEEARKRLAEMGVEVDGVLGALVTEPVQEQQTNTVQPVVIPEPEPVKPEPVKPADVKLKINTLCGEWFRYTRMVDNAGIDIELNTGCIATADDVDALCTEIKTAFAMMA